MSEVVWNTQLSGQHARHTSRLFRTSARKREENSCGDGLDYFGSSDFSVWLLPLMRKRHYRRAPEHPSMVHTGLFLRRGSAQLIRRETVGWPPVRIGDRGRCISRTVRRTTPPPQVTGSEERSGQGATWRCAYSHPQQQQRRLCAARYNRQRQYRRRWHGTGMPDQSLL